MQRRNVLKAMGGIGATAALGVPFASPVAAGHDEGDYRGVRVNQVGYPIGETKIAIGTSQAMDVNSVSTFEVVDVETGESVDDGTLEGPYEDEAGSDHTLVWADFSDFDEPGEYRVVIGSEESHPFKIGDASDLYAPLLRDVGRLYTLKRSNTRIEDQYTGLEIGPGHTQDQEAIIAEPEGDWLEDYSAGDTIDVSNGWYDAGDYGKYVVPAGISVAQLMLAYERNPDAFHVGQFYIDDLIDDEHLGELPDVLVECKEELRFLEQMQRPNGSLFYKVAGNQSFPDDDVAPEDDDMERYVFGTSSVGTAHACGAFAMAARVYREAGATDFANRMLENAEAAWAWLDDNEELVWETSVNQDAGSGAYGRGDYDEPDRFWAAAELMRTTGNSSYDTWIQETDLTFESFDGEVSLPGAVEAPIDWNNPVGLGHYAYFWGGGDLAGTDHEEDGTAAAGLNGPFWVTNRYIGSPDAEEADRWMTGTYDYYWGWIKSGLSRAVQGIWSIEMHEEIGNSWITTQEGSPYIYEPLHYALGRSATGHSHVVGYGEKATENPHDRIVQSTGTRIPGMMIGGGHNDNLPTGPDAGDCTADHVDSSTPHLMSYVDQHCSYATNEWAINYTAPLFMMLAEVVGEITDTPEPGENWDGGEDCAAQGGIEIGDNCAMDENGDSYYRDIDGSGSTGSNDVVEFFQNFEEVQDNTDAFDFNDSGSVGFDDVVALFNQV